MKLDELIQWLDGHVKVVESTTGKTIFEGNPFSLKLGEINSLDKWLVGCVTVRDGKLFVAVDETTK